ncbi:hypothetical protein D3C75_842550 [compost metagenome]
MVLQILGEAVIIDAADIALHKIKHKLRCSPDLRLIPLLIVQLAHKLPEFIVILGKYSFSGTGSHNRITVNEGEIGEEQLCLAGINEFLFELLKIGLLPLLAGRAFEIGKFDHLGFGCAAAQMRLLLIFQTVRIEVPADFCIIGQSVQSASRLGPGQECHRQGDHQYTDSNNRDCEPETFLCLFCLHFSHRCLSP